MSKHAPVKKNQTIALIFEDMTHEGNGVGKLDGYPVFVPNTLPGEEADVKIIFVKKNFAIGKLVELKKESPHRVDPPCAVYHQCGGCQLQHMDYEMQLEMKRQQVENVFKKIAHITDVEVKPTLGMEDPWRYRNKVQIPVGEKDGELITGFYRKKSHEIIDGMETCIITDKVNDTVVEKVRAIASSLGIRAYDEKIHKGTLRHIVVRRGKQTGQLMLVLVTRTKTLPHKQAFLDEIIKAFPEIDSIVQNVNSQRTNVILGKETMTLYGSDYIYDTIGDVKFAISAKSFYQVNPDQTKVLYDQALAFAGLTGKETVIDAYCGIGTISLFLAQQAKHVYGVEIVPEAIDDAKKNAELNHITNAEFVVGEAEKVMPWWTAQGLRPDVIVVDPPRKGCDEALLKAMIDMGPERIVYVSCNPATLARDVKVLADHYDVKQIQPVDMFPQTSHVETVVLLSRVEK
jgi:23S rRNA (uracil1939-C5)-methyltransferase